MNGQRPYISLSEAGKVSGYTAEYLRQLCVKGKLEAHKIGKSWVTTLDAIEKFKASLDQKQLTLDQAIGTSVSSYTRFQKFTATGVALVVFFPAVSQLTSLPERISALQDKTRHLSISTQNYFEQKIQDYIRQQLAQMDLGTVAGTTTVVEVPVHTPDSKFQIPDSRPSASQGIVLGESISQTDVQDAVRAIIFNEPLPSDVVARLKGEKGDKGEPGQDGADGDTTVHYIPNSGQVFGITAPTAPQGHSGTIGSATYLSSREFRTEKLFATDLSSLSNTNITGDLTVIGDIDATGNFTITGDTTLTGHLLPGVDNTYNLGSESARWADLHLGPDSLNIYSTAGNAGAGNDYVLGNLGFNAGALTLTTANHGSSTGGQINFVSSFPSGNLGTAAFNITTSDDLDAGDEVLNIGDSAGTLLTIFGNGNLTATGLGTFDSASITNSASIGTALTVPTIYGSTAPFEALTLRGTASPSRGPVLIPDATVADSALVIGSDTNLYRSAADVLRTDDSFLVGSNFTVNGSTINLAGDSTVIDLVDADSTLSINTTTNRPVTFGSGLVTIPNLSVTNSQSNNGTMTINSAATTATIFEVIGNSLTSGTAIQKTVTANAGNGQITKGEILSLVDSTTAGGGFTGIGITVTGSGTGSGNKYLLSLNPNTANNEVVFDNTGAFRPTTSVASNTATIGSPSFYWKNGYFDQITANNLAGTVITGATSSTTWTIGSTEAGDVNEAIIFQRNSGSGNATIQWNAGANDLRYLTVNYPFNSTYTVDDASIGTGINLFSGNLTNNTTSGTQRLLSLTNAGTGTTEHGIYIDNTGTGTTALEIAGTWTNGIITNNNNINAGTGTLTAGITTLDSLILGGGYGSTGVTVTTDGDISADGDVTIDGALTVTGSVGYNGDITITKQDPTLIFAAGSASDTKFWAGVTDDNGNDDDDVFQIGDGTTPGTNPFLTINTSGNVGIGTTNPNYKLEVAGTSGFGGNMVFTTDNAYDIGQAAANRPRNVYVASGIRVGTGGNLASSADGVLAIWNNANTDFNRLQFGGTTSAFPAIKRNAAGIDFRLADDSAYADIAGGNITVNAGALSFDGDTFLQRPSAGVIEQRNGTNAQEFYIYNTYTDASNYERLRLAWSNNVASIMTQGAGTGGNRTIQIRAGGDLQFGSSNGIRWAISGGGHLRPFVDNTYDIGAVSDNRPRNLYLAGNAVVGGSLTVSGSITHNGNVTITKQDPTVIFNAGDTNDTKFWAGVTDDNGNDDDDVFQIGDGTTPGTNPFLTINTSGNVGIGTTAPETSLHLESVSAGSVANVLRIKNGSSSIGSGAAIDFSITSAATVNPVGKIEVVRTDSTAGGAGYMAFYTRSAGSPAERLRIDELGNVGIGTTAPNSKLSVVGSSGAAAGFGVASFTGGIEVRIGSDADHGWIQSYSSKPFAINPLGNNVGIGTTNPGKNLDIVGTARVYNPDATTGVAQLSVQAGVNQTSGGGCGTNRDRDIFQWLSSSGTVYGFLNCVGTAQFNAYVSVVDNSLSVRTSAHTNGLTLSDQGTYMRIQSFESSPLSLNPLGNNVGIGTTNPGELLHIYGGTSDTKLKIYSTTNNVGLHLEQDGATDSSWLVQTVPTDGRFRIYDAQTATAEALSILQSGNVGIGTTSPVSKLQIHTTNAFSGTSVASSELGSAGNNVSIITTNAQAANVGGMIVFGGMRNDAATDPGVFGGIRGGKENSTTGNTSGYLGLYTLEGGVGFAERMRITSTGNVGIGTTTPLGLLDVNHDTDQTVYLGRAAIGSPISDNAYFAHYDRFSSTAYALRQAASGDTFINSPSTVSLSINNTTALRVDNSGNVGIGTTVPGNLLHIYATTNTPLKIESSHTNAIQVVISNTATGGREYRLVNTADVNSTGGGNFAIFDATASSYRLLINSNGNVGIGTTNPSELLDITSSSAASSVHIRGALNFDSSIKFDENGTDRYKIGYDASDNIFRISRTDFGNADFVIADSTGNIGIGLTDPAHPLSIAATSQVLTPSNSQINLRSIRTAFSADQLVGGISFESNDTTFTAPGFNVASILAVSDTAHNSSNHDTSLRFLTSTGTTNAERMRISAAGNVGIGTTNPGRKLSVVGGTALIENTGTGGQVNDILRLYDTTTAQVNTGPAIRFVANRTTGGSTLVADVAGIITDISNGAPKGALVLSTINSGGGTPVERMRIDHSGNVGIGTTNPGGKLHVAGGAADTTIMVSGKADNSVVGRLQYLNGFGTTLNLTKEDGTETVRLRSYGDSYINGGNVGIGTTSPITTLQLSGNQYIGSESSLTTDITSPFGTPKLSLVTNQASNFGLVSIGNSANTTGAQFIGAKTRATDASADVIVQNADQVLAIKGFAADGASYREAARIQFDIDGTPGASDMPGRITFSTTADGAASVTERMRITSSGTVAIGTTSPLSSNSGLDISSGGIGLVVGADNSASTRTNSTAKFARIGAAHYTNAEEPFAIFMASSDGSNNSVNIGGGTGTLNTSNIISFFTAATTTTLTGTERMRIDASGNVGIGTTNPAYGSTTGTVLGLNNTGAGSTLAFLRESDSIADTGILGQLQFYAGSSAKTEVAEIEANVSGTSEDAGFLTFSTKASAGSLTERLRIDSSGNVGIGTTNPGNLLHIDTGSDTNLRFGYLSSSSIAAVNDANNAYNTMRLDASPLLLNSNSSGNVGIGTTNPSTLLHINSITHTFARISTSNTGGNLGLQFVNTGDGNEDWTIGRHNTGYFYVGNTADAAAEALVISTGGNVGIGTTSNIFAKLTINGNIGTVSEGDIFSQYDGDSTTSYPVFARYWDSHGTWPSTTFIFGNGTNAAVGIEKPGNQNVNLFQVRANTSVFSGDNAGYLASFTNEGNNSNRLGIAMSVGADDASGTNTAIKFNDGDGTEQGTITFSGGTTSYNTTSDIRLKTNIQNTLLGLNELMQIEVRDYSFIADPAQKTHTGFIAQQLYGIYPNAVTVPNDPNGIWSVDYSKLTPLLTKGIQELNNKISGSFTGTGLVVGDVVTVDNMNHVARSTEQGTAAGVVTSVSGSSVRVGFTGTVQMKVSEENGQIRAGDRLKVSELMPGYAAKQVESGNSIGVALENSQGGTEGLDVIQVSISLGYHKVNVAQTQSGDLFTVDSDYDFQNHSLVNVKTIASMSGKWEIGEDGTIRAMRIIADSVETRKLKISGASTDSTVGRDKFPVGSQERTIHNNNITPTSTILITFRGDYQGRYWIDAQGLGNFTIKLSQAAATEVAFDYWIVDTEQEQLEQGSGDSGQGTETPEGENTGEQTEGTTEEPPVEEPTPEPEPEPTPEPTPEPEPTPDPSPETQPEE